MNTLLLLCAVVLGILLLIVTSVAPPRSRLSAFERKRRAQNGDGASQLDLRREATYNDVTSLQRVLVAVLLVSSAITLTFALNVYAGIFFALILAVEYNAIARMPAIHRVAMQLYVHYEPYILQFAESYKQYLWWVRSITVSGNDMQAHSRDELEHIVTSSQGVLTEEQKLLIQGAMFFDDTTVGDCMTKKSQVRFIKKSEILGPLVLNDLHSTGHTSFPVTKDDSLDQVIGILHLADVQTIDTKRKHTALVETAMRPHVHTITKSESLASALKKFLKTEQHLLVVINQAMEPIGILTLADVVKKLFGARVKH